MLDVFLDMTNTAQGHFGNSNGGRCAVGSALWEIGIPHDRLLPRCILRKLSNQDQLIIQQCIPMLYREESGISCWYDEMVRCLGSPGELRNATESAGFLLAAGRLTGINFIIASPLPKHSTKPKEVAHA